MTANWAAIARKDFDDSIRSLTLVFVTGIYTFLVALVVATPGLLSDSFAAEAATSFVVSPTWLIVPVLALVASYLAIAGERESGTLKLLLGMPPTRREVVLGKLLGRMAVTTTAVVVAFTVGALLLAVVYGDVPVVGYGLLMALTVLLAAAFVGIAVGLSAASRARATAMAAAIGLYMLFVVLWDLFIGALQVVVALMEIDVPNSVFTFLSVLSPTGAYNRLVNSIVGPSLGDTTTMMGQQAPAVGQPEALYLADGVVVSILLAWLVVPVLLGYLRFEVADLA